jgi:hypothetical protein
MTEFRLHAREPFVDLEDEYCNCMTADVGMSWLGKSGKDLREIELRATVDEVNIDKHGEPPSPQIDGYALTLWMIDQLGVITATLRCYTEQGEDNKFLKISWEGHWILLYKTSNTAMIDPGSRLEKTRWYFNVMIGGNGLNWRPGNVPGAPENTRALQVYYERMSSEYSSTLRWHKAGEPCLA